MAAVAQPIKNLEDVASLYRDLSRHPNLSSAYVGPDVTTQYGGKYCNLYTEWAQRDLDRNEQVKFCRQYIVFHDNNTIVYSGPCGNSCEIKGELLSRESPSGALKAVLRDTTNAKGVNTQFLEIWNKNCKVKSINLTSLDKHGKVYEDDQFGCVSWSHSESHILYIAEKKRPKTESFFQPEVKNLKEALSGEDGAQKPIKGDQFLLYEDWGEGLVSKSVPVLCVMDIESGNISVLEGIPDYVSPGQNTFLSKYIEVQQVPDVCQGSGYQYATYGDPGNEKAGVTLKMIKKENKNKKKRLYGSNPGDQMLNNLR